MDPVTAFGAFRYGAGWAVGFAYLSASGRGLVMGDQVKERIVLRWGEIQNVGLKRYALGGWNVKIRTRDQETHVFWTLRKAKAAAVLEFCKQQGVVVA